MKPPTKLIYIYTLNIMEWKKTLKESIIFSLRPKRWLPFFALDGVFALLGLLLLMKYGGIILTQASSSFPEMLNFFAQGIILFVAYFLLKIWVKGAMVQQSYKEIEKIGKSYRVACSKYLSLLGAVVIVMVINWLVGYIPIAGLVFRFIISLIFFFIYQGVIVKGLGFDKTLEHSYKIFRKNWALVFAMFIVLSIISLLIVGVFSIPLLYFLVPIALEVMKTGNLFALLISNVIPLAITSVILLVGFAISQVFYLKAQTDFYLQLIGKRFAKKARPIKKRGKKKSRKSK